MELEDLSYLVLILGVLSITFVGFVSDLSSKTNITVDTQFNSTYNKITEESQRINQSNEALFGTGVNSDFSFLPTVQSFMGVGSILTGSLGVLNQMMEDMATTLALPKWLVMSFSSMLMIGFIYAIYRATLGRLKI